MTITTNNGDPLAVSVAENQTAVTTIAASDVDVGDTFTWTLSGTDAALFDISNAGVITFKTAPDFEAPADFGGNNVYDLIVNVSDGTVSDTPGRDGDGDRRQRRAGVHVNGGDLLFTVMAENGTL